MAAEKPIRFGVLGAARIVPKALIEPARIVPGVQVLAIAARDSKRAREFAAHHGIARVHAGYADLIGDPEIDVIYNPLPNSLHCAWTIAALRAGKHVLCEKPLASNAEEAAQMADAAARSGRILGEAFHYCYHPLAARVREIIRSGALGALRHVEGCFTVPMKPANNIRFEWLLAGGATMDLGCYPLHMIRHFSGMAPRVTRAAARIGPPNIDLAMDVEMELDHGVTARMVCSMDRNTRIAVLFSARGERGEMIVTNPVGPHLGNKIVFKTAAGEKEESVPGDTSYTHQVRAFVAAVRGDRAAFATDGAEGVINMQVIDGVYRAAGLPIRGTE